ncbi:hypothetical protein [Cumulibacter manganitolerans]|uniref:hypothetical protein n=1 Tax=Cumulibacter manganitolerans TaxID=1884992 RepID=UPI0012956424|nr:hypothetical protein [Cumulibacter manganitolerans]
MPSSLGWIAVPGGRVLRVTDAGAAAREVALLRVLIVPRLSEELAGTALEDWPATINAAQPVVEIRHSPDADPLPGAHPPPGADPLAGATPQPIAATLRRLARSDTWRSLTGHGLGVRPWQPPEGYDAPTVRPTLSDAASIEATYRQAARKPGDETVVREALADWRAPAAARARVGDAPVFEKVDFHRAVSLLREHPYVLRMLGLILELEIDPALLPRSGGADRPQVRVRWPESPVAVESPWTAYEFDGRHFLPASSGDIKRGVVDLSDSAKWTVLTVDVDGAVGRLREAARVVLAGEQPPTDAPAAPPAPGGGPIPASPAAPGNLPAAGSPPEGGSLTTAADLPARASLPTLRSAGLQIARIGRAQQLATRTARGRGAARAPSLAGRVLDADDLVLGYRIDVRPQKTEDWFSLHARRATYTLDGQPVGDEPSVDEEGHLKPFAAVRGPDGVHTDEVVARWSGWSLSLPRPPVGRQPLDVATDRAEELIPYQFAARYEIPKGSLPELQFGRTYQLRARVVDVAGGGLELDDAAASTEPTREVPYVRYEPVPPPAVLQPDGLLVPDPHHPDRLKVDLGPLGPGGTPERLVVRSEPGPDGAFTAAPFAGDLRYPANDARTIVAPPTTFQIAEQHALLPADQTGLDRMIRASLPSPRGALPDPLALGAAITLMPEPGGIAAIDTEARPWGGAWPDHEEKRIRLVPGGADDEIGFHWDPSPPGVDARTDPAATAFVTVPPGQRVVTELSSSVLQGNLSQFAITTLANAPDADTATITGRHPLITPATRIELVHAVRQPRAAPTGTLTPVRTPGATHVVLEPHDAVLGIHTQSTAQLELRASWTEWDDAPEGTTRSAPLPPVAVTYGADRLRELRQEFGDTKHRMVDYTATAVSRYRDCFDPDDSEELFRVESKLPPVLIKSTARPAPPVITSTVPAFAFSEAPGAGALVRTRAAGRLRVHLGRPWFTTGEGECVAVIVWPGTEDDIPDQVRPLVSWFNRDPIHPTTAPKALADEASFAGEVDPLSVPLVETGDVVRVLPYPVSFHEGSPFADIELPAAAAASYAPFAHLAIARFQRQSLDGLQLSTIVRTDMVPVLPDRRLEVIADAAGVQLTLSGLSRVGTRPNRVTAVLERATGTLPDAAGPASPDEGPGGAAAGSGGAAGVPGGAAAGLGGAAGPGGAAVARAGDVGWGLTALGSAAPVFPAWTRVPGAVVSGTTNAPLPVLPLPQTGDRLRVVVRETEDLGPRADELLDAADELAERTVYLDVIPLPLSE